MSCVFLLNFISNPIVEFVDGKQEARGFILREMKGVSMKGQSVFAWQCLCYHFVFVFLIAGGQQIGRCK